MSTREDIVRLRAMRGDLSPLGLYLERPYFEPYFCTPEGAELVSDLGVDGVHFVVLPGDERVFLVDPAFGEIGTYVTPAAEDMRQFLSFIVSCRSANVISQIWWMNEAQYAELLAEDAENPVPGTDEAIDALRAEFDITPVDPFGPVKAMCRDFDSSFIRFSDEYYDVLGIERE